MWADEIDRHDLPVSWQNNIKRKDESIENLADSSKYKENVDDFGVDNANLDGNKYKENVDDLDVENASLGGNKFKDNLDDLDASLDGNKYKDKLDDSIQSVQFSFTDVGNFAFQKSSDNSDFFSTDAAEPSSQLQKEADNQKGESNFDRITYNFVNQNDDTVTRDDNTEILEEHEWNIKDDEKREDETYKKKMTEKKYDIVHNQSKYLYDTKMKTRPNYIDDNGNVVTSEWLKEIEFRRSLTSGQKLEAAHHTGRDKLQPRSGQSEILGKFLHSFSSSFK